MSRWLTFAALLAATGPDNGPPTKVVDEHYTAVRKDVLAQMNVADINLPKCESALAGAQVELKKAAVQLDEMERAAQTLQAQKMLLEAHVTTLETLIARQRSDFSDVWEQVDGPLGLAVGWGVGTAQCVGLAWVFNQPAMK
jgi:hypothetical protein